jgi:hypothetical protein
MTNIIVDRHHNIICNIYIYIYILVILLLYVIILLYMLCVVYILVWRNTSYDECY